MSFLYTHLSFIQLDENVTLHRISLKIYYKRSKFLIRFCPFFIIISIIPAVPMHLGS